MMKPKFLLPPDLLLDIAFVSMLVIVFAVLGYLSREFALDMKALIFDVGVL